MSAIEATPTGVVVRTAVKAADYDRHFAAKVQGKAHVAVVYNAGEATSEAAAKAALAELSNTGKIAGFAHDEELVAYPGADVLAAEVRSKSYSVVVLAPALGSEMPGLAHALDGIAVLTVALDPADVSRGAVFGVDVASGTPKMTIAQAQARRQDVAFEASLLKLANVL
ncbi:MAG TPA: YfiR family protein [Polyangiaceae bacterium]